LSLLPDETAIKVDFFKIGKQLQQENFSLPLIIPAFLYGKTLAKSHSEGIYHRFT